MIETRVRSRVGTRVRAGITLGVGLGLGPSPHLLKEVDRRAALGAALEEQRLVEVAAALAVDDHAAHLREGESVSRRGAGTAQGDAHQGPHPPGHARGAPGLSAVCRCQCAAGQSKLCCVRERVRAVRRSRWRPRLSTPTRRASVASGARRR